jgi:hypothetical protein
MPRIQRVALYIQRLAHENLIEVQERDERPDDAMPSVPEPTSNYSDWNASSFPVYRPFRGPPSS